MYIQSITERKMRIFYGTPWTIRSVVLTGQEFSVKILIWVRTIGNVQRKKSFRKKYHRMKIPHFFQDLLGIFSR